MKKTRRPPVRILTQKEMDRVIHIRALSKRLISEGWRSKTLTVSIIKANIYALLIGLPVCAVCALAFFLCAGFRPIVYSEPHPLLWLPAILIAIPLHELIHGLVWGLLAKDGFRAIEFGFIREYLTPYCTSREPMRRLRYIAGSAMPGVLLGLVPLALSIPTGSIFLLIFGVYMTLAAGGDFTVILKLLSHRPTGREVLCVDHPTECGLILFERQ